MEALMSEISKTTEERLSDAAVQIADLTMKNAMYERGTLEEIEEFIIKKRLTEVGGNQRAAARSLGLSRWTLGRRIRRYGICVPKTEHTRPFVQR